MQYGIAVSSTAVGFLLGFWSPVGDWELSPVSCRDEDEFGGEGHSNGSAVWGNRFNMRNQGLVYKEGQGSIAQTSSALVSASHLVGIFLVFGACQGKDVGRMPGEVKPKQNYREDLVRAL